MFFGNKKRGRKKVALALGSGNARGLAHIGVIKALEKHKIPIDMIAGASIGAFVGAMYAASRNVKEIEGIALDIDESKVFEFLYDPSVLGGFVKGDKITDFIRSYFDDLKFSDLKLPFQAIATDLSMGEKVVMAKGGLTEAIRASISIPVIFDPVKKDGRFLVDGGLSEPVPVLTAKKMGADIVVAVNLDSPYCLEPRDIVDLSVKKVLECTMNIARNHLSKECTKFADVVVEPKFGDLGLFSFDKYYEHSEEMIKAGEKAIEEKVDFIKKLLD